MVKKIIAICGESGTGKTTIANLVNEKMLYQYRIPTITTRPPREREKHGLDYFFWDFNAFIRFKDALFLKDDYTNDEGKTFYFGALKSLVDTQKYPVMVLTPKGIQELKDLGYDVISILIRTPENIRNERLDTRKEITRYKADDRMFKGFEPDYLIKNISLEKTLKAIEYILLEEKVLKTVIN